MDSQADDRVVLGRYEIQGLLGSGRMGTVYLAADHRLGNRKVAIKTLSIDRLSPGDRTWRIEAFRREASLLASLNHQGLASVMDFLVEGDTAYLVMDYVLGQSLREILDSMVGNRLSQDQALQITDQLCDVLGYLHSRQPSVIFRDLKPSNIMIQSDGLVKLIDFGISRHFQPGKSSDTRQLGTVGYAAPEQYSGQTDARSDIYSLGVVLHEMATGFNPTRLAPGKRPPSLDQFPDIGWAHIGPIADKATRLKPAERYPTVATFRQALSDVSDPDEVPRFRLPIWLAGIVLILAIAGVAYGLAQSNQANVPIEPRTPYPTDTVAVATGQTNPEATVTSATMMVQTDYLSTTPTAVTSQPTTAPESPTHEPSAALLAGQGVVHVTDIDGQEYVASYSPDQQTLVFMGNQTGSWQIHSQPAGGGPIRNLTNNDSDNYHPRFSPDGQRIIFASNVSGGWEIYSMELDGSGWIHHVNIQGSDQYPSFNSISESIIYMSDRGNGWGIFSHIDNGGSQVVLDTSADETYPSFSWDGQMLVFQSNQEGSHDVYIMGWPDGVPYRLTTHPARDANPVFSPDDRWIIFESDRDGDYEIYAVRPDGTDLRNLTDHTAKDQVPFFSPDGQWLIFSSDRDGDVDIYRQKMDTLLGDGS